MTAKPPPFSLLILLVAGLLTIDFAAVVGIVNARQRAELEALQDLERQTEVHARGFENRLVELRAELTFLSRSLQTPDPAVADPMARRWQTRDLEATLLHFSESSPALQRLAWLGGDGQTQVVVARSGGIPTLRAGQDPQPFDPNWLALEIPRPSGTLTATVDPLKILELSAPGLEDRLRLERVGVAPTDLDQSETLIARVALDRQAWPQLPAWQLESRQSREQAIRSVERLATRFRNTLWLNSGVLALSLVLGGMVLQSYRKVARLEAEQHQQRRLHELGRQLYHSERLSSLGHLTAALAHEINNPLEGMANYLRLLEKDLAENRLDGALGRLDPLRDGLARVGAVVRRALEAADPGRAPRERIDLEPLLRETVAFVRGVSDRSLRFDLELHDAPLQVDGQAVTLGQVFLNLMRNACQAQLERPGAGPIEIRAWREGDSVRISFADRGPGLAPAVLERLFQPFSSSRGSLGLGLSVCQDIIEEHGGTISGQNRADGGALFLIRLPSKGPQ